MKVYDSPLLSVIVPVYNCEKWLTDCVRSIQNQDYETLEIILVNDGSIDGSGALCDSFAENDKRIKVYHQQNGGQSVARNLALDKATGEYIAFIDADDYYIIPEVFTTCIQLMQKDSTLDFVQFPLEKEGEVHNMQDIVINSVIDKFRCWLTDKTITNYLCDKVFKRKVFETLRMPEGMIFEDRYLFADILSLSGNVLLTSLDNQAGYFYRTQMSQTTRRKKNTFFLGSEIKADVHILNTMPRQLTDLYLLVCWRAITNMKLLKEGDIDINKSVSEIIFARIPIGIKLSILFIKIMGIRQFIWFYRYELKIG